MGPMALQTLASTDLQSYLPVTLVVLMAVSFAVANVVISQVLGPRRPGETKGQTYESGMNPVGTARKRFNVRFYIMAMTFLVFDIEIIFLYPWAVSFTQLEPQGTESAIFLGRILFFIATSVVAYVYAWKKGVFSWD